MLYVISMVLLSKIPVNTDASQGNKSIEIFISSNGVHTDVIVPVKNEIKDWSKDILFEQTKSKEVSANYLGFGWGDKEFYLNTPEWSDLKLSTALKAAFNLGDSAIHTTFYNNLKEDESCKKIKISEEEYQKVVLFISESFQLDPNNKIQWIAGHNYGNRDAFYEAKGGYSLFYTCNTWTNNALKAANQKACLWTVQDKGILYHYK